MLRITKDRFAETHNVTIGAAFSAKVLKLPNGHEVKLHIWDTAGVWVFGTSATQRRLSNLFGCRRRDVPCYDSVVLQRR